MESKNIYAPFREQVFSCPDGGVRVNGRGEVRFTMLSLRLLRLHIDRVNRPGQAGLNTDLHRELYR